MMMDTPFWQDESEKPLSEICVHCSAPYLSTEVDTSTHPSIQELLTIFKLNYLTAFDSASDEDPTENGLFQDDKYWKLCPSCCQMWINLHHDYNYFLQLGQLNSCLIKRIRLLDQIIQSHQEKIINCDLVSNIKREVKICPTQNSLCSTTVSCGDQGEPEAKQNTNDLSKLPQLQVVLTRLPEKYLKQYENTITLEMVNETDEFSLFSDHEDDFPGENHSSDDDYNPMEQTVEIIKSQTETDSSDEDSCSWTSPKSSKKSRKKLVKKLKSKKRKEKKSKVKKSSNDENPDSVHSEKSSNSKKYEFDLIKKRSFYDYLPRKTIAANPCWYCKLDFQTPTACFEHTQMEHLSQAKYTSPVICVRCSKICQNDHMLRKHLRKCELIPSGEILPKTFQCEFCYKIFGSLSMVEKHKQTHTNDSPLLCKLCPYVAKTMPSLEKHKAKRHPDIIVPDFRVQCEDCGSVLKTVKYLERHKFYMHTEEGNKMYKEKQKIASSKKREQRNANRVWSTYTKCQDCDLDFYSRLALINHRREFHRDNMGKEHICDLCGKDFTTPQALRIHLRRHSDDRPFICELCGKGFKMNHNLKDHVEQTHTQEGKIKYNIKARERNERKKRLKMHLASLQKQEPNQNFMESLNLD